MNLQEATKLLKDNGYAIIKEEFTDEETTKINSEKQKLLFDELTAVKNEFTPEESHLIGIDAMLSNVKYDHAKYEKGETGIVIHDEEYEQNPELFKKFTEVAKNYGFEVEFKYVNRGVFVGISWLF